MSIRSWDKLPRSQQRRIAVQQGASPQIVDELRAERAAAVANLAGAEDEVECLAHDKQDLMTGMDVLRAKLAEAEANQASLWAAISAGQRALAASEARCAVAVEALREILLDHDERVRIYGADTFQPHRVMVMERGRAVLASPDLAPMARLLEAVKKLLLTFEDWHRSSNASYDKTGAALVHVAQAARAIWPGGGE